MTQTDLRQPADVDQGALGRPKRTALILAVSAIVVVAVVVTSVLLLNNSQTSAYNSVDAANSAAQSLGIDTSGIPPWQHQARVIRADMVAIGASTDPSTTYNTCNSLVGDTHYALTNIWRPYSDPSRSWTWNQYNLVQSAIGTLNQAGADCRTIGQELMDGTPQTVNMAHVQSEVNTFEQTWLKAGNLHLGVLPFPTA